MARNSKDKILHKIEELEWLIFHNSSTLEEELTLLDKVIQKLEDHKQRISKIENNDINRTHQPYVNS